MRIARRKLGALVLPVVAPTLLRLLSGSWKLERLGMDHWERARAASGCLLTLWHGRMLLGIRAHEKLGIHVLVSPSDDGSLITMMLTRFGYHTVRGSSNKNPARAIRALLTQLASGATIAITPDGPRGPRHSINPGAVWIARESGFPILPCGFVCDRAWHLKSWDRFTVPKWGARVRLVYGEPLRVPKDASDEDMRALSEEMGARIHAAEAEGLRQLGVEAER